jgi:hypothetical protein
MSRKDSTASLIKVFRNVFTWVKTHSIFYVYSIYLLELQLIKSFLHLIVLKLGTKNFLLTLTLRDTSEWFNVGNK